MPNLSAFKSDLTHILDARMLSFRVGNEEGDYLAPEEVAGVSFRVKSEESFNLDQKQVLIILNIWIDALLQPTDPEDKSQVQESRRYEGLGFCRLGFIFFLENFEDLVTPSGPDGGLVVDGQAMSHLLGMAYSTSRGMILVKTRGTSLEGSLLPVLDPKTLMAKGLEVQEAG